jgi:MFS family permease
MTTAAAPAPAVQAVYPAPRTAWTAVGVLLALYALSMIDRQIVSLMVGDLKRDLAISDFQVSLLQGFSFALLYCILGLPFGMAVDRLPRRNVICFGVLVWATAATCCGLAQNFPQLLAARTMVGAGEAALAPAAYSILSDMFPKRRLTMALSIYTIGATIGQQASLALGGFLLHVARDGIHLPMLGEIPAWRFAFLATGAPGLLLAFLIFVIPEPRRGLAGAPPTAAGSWGDVFRFMRARWAFFACHLIGFSAIMALAYAQMSWTPAFLIRRFGWEVDQVGVTLGSFGLVMGLFTFLTTGALVDWLMKKGMLDAHFRYYLWGSIAALVAGALCFLSPTPTPFFAGLAIIAIPCNMAAIAASAIQLVTPAGLRGRVSAVYLMVVALFAMTVGPSMVGLLTDDVFKDPQKIHLSLSVTYAILSPIAIAAFAFGLGPMRQAVRRADETA